MRNRVTPLISQHENPRLIHLGFRSSYRFAQLKNVFYQAGQIPGGESAIESLVPLVRGHF
ncbi:hypothetical protein D3C78_856700 [compost metagenome]